MAVREDCDVVRTDKGSYLIKFGTINQLIVN
jgi:hypothetical protein